MARLAEFSVRLSRKGGGLGGCPSGGEREGGEGPPQGSQSSLCTQEGGCNAFQRRHSTSTTHGIPASRLVVGSSRARIPQLRQKVSARARRMMRQASTCTGVRRWSEVVRGVCSSSLEAGGWGGAAVGCSSLIHADCDDFCHWPRTSEHQRTLWRAIEDAVPSLTFWPALQRPRISSSAPPLYMTTLRGNGRGRGGGGD